MLILKKLKVTVQEIMRENEEMRQRQLQKSVSIPTWVFILMSLIATVVGYLLSNSFFLSILGGLSASYLFCLFIYDKDEKE